MISAEQRKELAHLQASLGEWALADVRKAAQAGAKVGAFILGANLIDVLARLAYSKPAENGRAAWAEFIPVYLDRYETHADALYTGFRCAISHNYSLGRLRLTDGAAYSGRHWEIEEGERVLHLESFVDDLDRGFAKFIDGLEQDHELRDRVLARIRHRPLLGIVGGSEAVPSASASWSPTTTAVATHFGLSAQAATGTPPSPRMAIPKKRSPKGR